LTAAAERRPDAPAILAPGRTPLTHAALRAQIGLVGHALAAGGHGSPLRIALAVPSGAELAVALLAVGAHAGCAPLNPELDEGMVRRVLQAMRVDALIVLPDDDAPARRAACSLSIPIIELVTAPDRPAGCFTLRIPATGSPRDAASATPAGDDIALVLHTSGTTAAPKIVPLTHRRLTDSALARIELSRLSPGDRCLLGAPLFTAAGLRRGLLPPLLAGGSVVCPDGFDAVEFVNLIETFEPTFYTAPAAVQVAILEELIRRPHPLRHRLRFAETSGAPIAEPTRRRLEELLGVPVVIGYGITEAGSIAQTPLPPVVTPAGSVGLPTRMEISVRDDGGVELPADRQGEIFVRGPEVFGGYENDPQATAEALREGWFRTGDLGWRDAEGFLFVAGRVKELVNRGGIKIAPAEVEAVLMEHPAVTEAAAFALPHATLGEDLAAAVVLHQEATETQLRDHASRRLAAFKVPTRIFVLPEIPKAALGKPRRSELARVAAELMHDEFVPPRTDTERRVAAMFADILQVERVGANDSFLQLGGDSLRGVRLLAQLREAFGLTMRLDSLFREPTVAAIARTIDGEAPISWPDATRSHPAATGIDAGSHRGGADR